jgi:hypothetical protein
MSKMMIKMVADMAGIKPEDITAAFEQFQTLAATGVETLERLDARLARIEKHLGIEPAPLFIEGAEIERQE